MENVSNNKTDEEHPKIGHEEPNCVNTNNSKNDNNPVTIPRVIEEMHIEEATTTALPKSRFNICCSKLLNFLSIENKIAAFVILCMCAFFQNVCVGGANNAILTTIERAFYMTSIESAIFITSYDVANIIASPFIGYFGDKMHKPYVIGLSMIGLSFGSIITLIPEFISEIERRDNFNLTTSFYNGYTFGRNDTLCNPHASITLNHLFSANQSTEINVGLCQNNSILNHLKYIFFIANAVNGVSSVALYTIAISYIENMFLDKKAPIFQGLYYAIGAIGIGVGMLITGNLLNIDLSVVRKNSIKLEPSHPNYIGAWWIIYMFTAFINFLLGIIVLRFASSLGALGKIRKSKSQQQATDSSSSLSLAEHFKDFRKTGLEIISNKCYIFIVLCTTSETLLVKGFSSYLTKLIEYEFRLPASSATILAGSIGFVGLIGGGLLGSLLIKWRKWEIKHCIKFCTVILFITSFLFMGLLIHCPQEKFIAHSELMNSECGCDANLFEPVCYEEKYLFQSPCIAGCESKNSSNLFNNCRFVELLERRNRTITNSARYEVKTCARPANQCKALLVIVSIVCLAVLFLSSIVLMPILKVILESVDPENQSFALGIRSFFTKSFGNIPGPIIFASVVDQSCVFWSKRSCTGNKACRLYDNKSFSSGLGILGSCFRFLSACLALVTYLCVRKRANAPLQYLQYQEENSEPTITKF